MSDKQFSIGLKITAAITIILVIAIGIIAVNILKTEDTTASVLDEVENSNIVVNNEEIEANTWEN